MREVARSSSLLEAPGLALFVALLASPACGPGAGDPLIVPDVESRLAQFVPTPIQADLSALSATDRAVVERLVAASTYMDEIFLRQAWQGNPSLRDRLRRSRSARAAAALEYFRLSYGPWDRLDEAPFVGSEPRPETAGYYPDDLTREELEAWIASHPEDEESFRSLYTVIRRQGDGLVAIPYSVEYREWLEPAAAELTAAADLTEDESLARYLRRVAAAFLQDDYYESDLAWMDLDGAVEITIGPYEVYEDRLFGYKAAFESFVTLVDPEQSARLARYKAELPAMERNLPIPDEDKNLNRGTESPIRVADEIYTAGDTRAGVQTIAFNLPNDERVRESKGSKKVLLRNVMDAKFRQILQPIAGRVVDPGQRSLVASEQFFNETLFHELAHGLGPGRIQVDGRQTEVRLELKELYSTMEEAKADVMGVYNLLFLMNRGLLPADQRRSLAVTYLAGMFRSTRFGVAEAHGRGTAMQFNYLLERGVIREDEATGTFAVSFERFDEGIRSLLAELCMVQARGDYDAARAMLERYGVLSPSLEGAIRRLEGIPVDIRPRYPAAGEEAPPG